jgi:type II secretory pathway pseudopilin PulG
MNCAPQTRVNRSRPSERAFTLAEVLAALVFMAILIPVALEGLSIASRAGEVATRKSEAIILAESLINENAALTNGQSMNSGSTRQGIHDFRWTMRNEPWAVDQSSSAMRQLSVEVTYNAKGRDYSVHLSTLVSSGSSPGQSGGLP